MDKLRNEAEKERVSRQREREMLNIQQKVGSVIQFNTVPEAVMFS